MKFNFDFLTDWTVAGVNVVYRLTIQNLYFMLSNILFLGLLLVFRMTMNNFVLFLLPIFLMLISFLTQFKVIEAQEDGLALKKYGKMYVTNLKKHWKVALFYTLLIAFLVFDLQVLSLTKNALLYIPFLITSSFLMSSLFFVLLISTDERSENLPLGRQFFSALLISYKLPVVTLVNILCLIAMVVTLRIFPVAYICILGGAINYLIYLNCQRRFSVKLYFEEF